MIEIKRLVWDDWNIAHLARHGVLPDEVEEICQTNPQTEEAKKDEFESLD